VLTDPHSAGVSLRELRALALRYWPLTGLVVAVLCAFAASVLVAMATHRWRVPLEAWLPGASVLFLPPFAASLLAFALLARKAWGGSTLPTNLLAVVVTVVGTFLGLLLAIPATCAIAQECL